ncbi:MAG: histidinol-phosphate aminotransferase family protein [Clostridiales bacterium]|nr:histidinol-phosphate aminotransferase family protein [Clostridiales bacterium]
MIHGGNVWGSDAPSRWLDFSANLRPEGMPEWAGQVMKSALADARYYPDIAMTAARAGLAAYAGVTEDCVLPTAGGAVAIDLALSLSAGKVHLRMPTFGEYAQRAIIHGRELASFGDSIACGDTLMLCNPNNPTGHALTPSEVLNIHKKAAKHQATLVVDEAFIDYCAENSVRKHISNDLIIVGSLTKTLCIPGVRLGYVLADPKVISVLEKKDLPWSLNMLASAVAANLPAHLDEIKADAAMNQQRRAQMVQALIARGAMVHPSQANFLLVDFGRDMTEDVLKLRDVGILVRTCASFGLGTEYLRLAVKTKEENERLVNALWERY